MPNVAFTNYRVGKNLDSSQSAAALWNMGSQIQQQMEKRSAADKIRREEQYNQILDQQFVGVLSRAVDEGWDGARMLGELAKLPEMARTEYGRKLRMQLAMDQYERMQAAAAANAPAPEGMEVIGGRRDKYGNFIPSYGKVNQVILHGPGGMKYTYDPATKTATPIQGIEPSDSRETEEMKVIQAMSETEKQIDLLKRAIEEGADQDGNPADADLLRSEIARLEGLNANRRKRLGGSEALADYDRVKGTVERDLNRGDEVMRIGEAMPLSGYLEGIEQTKRAGIFDNVKDPAAIRAAMGRHVQDLVAQGLTLPEARAETERQFRLLQTADTGWFKTLPSEPMWAPLGQDGWQFSDKNQEPPVPELAPFWKGMNEEERATAVEYLRQGGDVKRIIEMLK